ncbi:MAG: type II toxin-antitoxin system HicB family antitoxin [Treponema sp.]|jgi:predicted RNase H-like HicB family nuclease|nr:type II toxin-antitoxin system HicB family antitoxin [Treponema sp.]
MKYVYPAFFYPEPDGRFSVEFADFELATFGDDLADAMYMAADAAAGRILSMLADGEELPAPSEAKNIIPDDPDGFVSMVFIDLDTLKSNHDEKPVKKTLTIPSWLNQAAERKNINFSATLKEALVEKIQA